ncbi:hypothetical protein H4S06_005138 [Coemansia sp. BCRC 34490]|nr:hypothetical protein H4S06_005138 [Coemansia sp. BCRC 34490]
MPSQQHQANKARRLVLTLEKGLTNCATEAATYGKCVVANVEAVGKHTCEAQFQTFKACAQKALGRKW